MRVALVLVLASMLGVPVGAADPAPRVTLSDTLERPGEPVKLGLILGTNGTDLRTLRVRLMLPRGLEFVKASLGINAEIENVTLSTTVKGGVPELELVSGKAGILPEGLLASLEVTIAKDAPKGDKLKVGAVVTGTPKSGDPISIDAEGGEVLVVDEVPLPTCFFYMH